MKTVYFFQLKEKIGLKKTNSFKNFNQKQIILLIIFNFF